MCLTRLMGKSSQTCWNASTSLSTSSQTVTIPDVFNRDTTIRGSRLKPESRPDQRNHAAPAPPKLRDQNQFLMTFFLRFWIADVVLCRVKGVWGRRLSSESFAT